MDKMSVWSGWAASWKLFVAITTGSAIRPRIVLTDRGSFLIVYVFFHKVGKSFSAFEAGLTVLYQITKSISYCLSENPSFLNLISAVVELIIRNFWILLKKSCILNSTLIQKQFFYQHFNPRAEQKDIEHRS